jgi:hypothetical protein
MTWRLARLLACAGVVAAVACIDITVDGDGVGSLQFVPLPYPSIDVGDTLRDAGNNVATLTAIAYRANGDVDTTLRPTFVLLNGGVTLDTATRYIVGAPLGRDPAANRDSTSRTVRIIASVPGLQTVARTILVVPRADTVHVDESKLVDTILYSLPAASTDVSDALQVTIGQKATSPDRIIPSAGYIVRYKVFKGTTQIPANDTLGAFSLRFRIRSGQATVDTVTVLAEAKRGNRLSREIRWTVIVRPKTAS